MINGVVFIYFWLIFGGEIFLLVLSDGLDIVFVQKDKFFFFIVEIYDFIVIIFEDGKIEIWVIVQDGFG